MCRTGHFVQNLDTAPARDQGFADRRIEIPRDLQGSVGQHVHTGGRGCFRGRRSPVDDLLHDPRADAHDPASATSADGNVAAGEADDERADVVERALARTR